VFSHRIDWTQTSFVAHDVGWIITAFFTIVATVASFWLINKHLQWYTVVRSLSARLPFPPVLISILFTQKREQRCRLFYFAALHVVCAVSPADFNILFADIIRLLLMVPIYSWISLASYLFWVRSLVSGSGPFCCVLTPVMKSPRITLHPCFSSATHTRPSSSPLSSISCSRICPRIPKCRKPSFVNVVCQRKPTRNADGVGSPEGSGSSLSDLSGGNRRCGGILVYTFLYPCQAQ
jgi:hypothetical protein